MPASEVTEQAIWDNEVEYIRDLPDEQRRDYLSATRKNRVLGFMGEEITHEWWIRWDRAVAIALGLVTGRA